MKANVGWDIDTIEGTSLIGLVQSGVTLWKMCSFLFWLENVEILGGNG